MISRKQTLKMDESIFAVEDNELYKINAIL